MTTRGPASTATRTATRPGQKGAARPAIDARLSIVHPTALRAAVAVGTRGLVLGRKPEGGEPVAVVHPTVSRSHFAIDWDAERGCHVGRNLGSHNGSRVNGHDAAQPTPLAEGAVIRVGEVVCVYEREAVSADADAVSREAIPGDAGATRRLRVAVARAAPDPAPVLLMGPTGTGKEHIAAELHRLSGRSGPLVAVNCAALASELVESQLFGHVRGAFTGATDAQSGFFRAADGGTLFLDEIGEMALELQPKLLRAIQDGQIVPVGATKPIRVNVRVVAATNRDLAELAESGGFRRDLYARLSLWELRVPALIERRADLLDWLEILRKRWAGRRGAGAALTLDADAAEALLLLTWPENLRRLDRLVHELQDRREVGLADLPPWVTPAQPSAPARATSPAAPLAAAAKPAIPNKQELAAVLAANGGSVRATAKHFARDRRQIYRWIESHGLKAKLED